MNYSFVTTSYTHEYNVHKCRSKRIRVFSRTGTYILSCADLCTHRARDLFARVIIAGAITHAIG